MKSPFNRSSHLFLAVISAFVSLGFLPQVSLAQDRLRAMPEYARYVKMRGEIAGSVKPLFLGVAWTDGSKSFEYTVNGKRYRYDLAARQATEVKEGSETPPQPN